MKDKIYAPIIDGLDIVKPHRGKTATRKHARKTMKMAPLFPI